MKLKNGFILHSTGDEYMAVAAGEAAKSFNGLVRNNATAQFIYEQLLTDTTEEKIADAMCAKFDAPRDVIAADVHRIVGQMREAGLLDG